MAQISVETKPVSFDSNVTKSVFTPEIGTGLLKQHGVGGYYFGKTLHQKGHGGFEQSRLELNRRFKSIQDIMDYRLSNPTEECSLDDIIRLQDAMQTIIEASAALFVHVPVVFTQEPLAYQFDNLMKDLAKIDQGPLMEDIKTKTFTEKDIDLLSKIIKYCRAFARAQKAETDGKKNNTMTVCTTIEDVLTFYQKPVPTDDVGPSAGTTKAPKAPKAPKGRGAPRKNSSKVPDYEKLWKRVMKQATDNEIVTTIDCKESLTYGEKFVQALRKLYAGWKSNKLIKVKQTQKVDKKEKINNDITRGTELFGKLSEKVLDNDTMSNIVSFVMSVLGVTKRDAAPTLRTSTLAPKEVSTSGKLVDAMIEDPPVHGQPDGMMVDPPVDGQPVNTAMGSASGKQADDKTAGSASGKHRDEAYNEMQSPWGSLDSDEDNGLGQAFDVRTPPGNSSLVEDVGRVLRSGKRN
jgi:hypothetical protein